MSHIAALLLAAGKASRYGSLKQLVEIDGVPMVRRVAQTALAAGVPLTVVIGAGGESLRAALAGLPLQIVENHDWATGMGGSIALGVRAVQATPVDALLILLADQVLIDAADLQAICAAHAADPQAIIAADHGDAAGPPCLFPSRDFAALGALSGPAGARRLLRDQSDRVRRLDLPHARLDVDTPADLQGLKTRSD